MGIDITMNAGWGVHIPASVFNRWIEDNYPESYESSWEHMDRMVSRASRRLTFDWPGNSWTGEDHGWVIYALSGYQSYDMGREVQAGLYRTPTQPPSGPDIKKLQELAVKFTGEELPVEWLISVGVS